MRGGMLPKTHGHPKHTLPVKPVSFWMLVLTFLEDLISGDAMTSLSKELRCWALAL